MSYDKIDKQLIALFQAKDLVGIHQLLLGIFPDAGVIPVLFSPMTEENWTSAVGVYKKDSYSPYPGQVQTFYRNLVVTQLGWGSDLFEVNMNLRALEQSSQDWVVDTQETQWVFNYKANKAEIMGFLEAL